MNTSVSRHADWAKPCRVLNRFGVLFSFATLWLGTNGAADDWRYTVTPYVWAPELDVELQVGQNPPVSSTQNLFDVLDGAFLLQGEARRKRWSVLGEFNYLNLSDDFTLGSVGPPTGWDLSGTMVTLGAGYAVYDADRARLEVTGGIRRWDLEATSEVGESRASDDVNFIDPVIGLRVETPLGRRLTFLGQANVGGDAFGSEQQIDAIAQVRVPLREQMNVSAGYRYLKLDFDEDSVVSDSTIQGPFISFSFDF